MGVWKCKECGTEVINSKDNPTEGFPKWKDGHECVFEEEK